MKFKIEGRLFLDQNKLGVNYFLYKAHRNKKFFKNEYYDYYDDSRFAINYKYILVEKEEYNPIRSHEIFINKINYYLDHPKLIREELEKHVMNRIEKEYQLEFQKELKKINDINKQGLFNFEIEIEIEVKE